MTLEVEEMYLRYIEYLYLSGEVLYIQHFYESSTTRRHVNPPVEHMAGAAELVRARCNCS